MTPPPERLATAPPAPTAIDAEKIRKRAEQGAQEQQKQQNEKIADENNNIDGNTFVAESVSETAKAEIDTTSSAPANRKRLRVGIVRMGVENQSTEGGIRKNEEVMSEKLRTRGWIRGFVTRIWRGSANKEPFERHYAREEKERIIESGNIHLAEGGTEEQSDATKAVVLDRMINKGLTYDNGETRRVISEDTLENKACITGVKQLLASHVRGEIDDSDFMTAKRLLLKETFPTSEELREEGAVFADDMFELAKEMKRLVEHGEALDDLLDEIEFVVAEADVGLNTETKLNKTAKLYDELLSKSWGPFNAPTVAFALTTLAALSRKGVTGTASFLGRKLAPIVGVGIIAGLAAGRADIRAQRDRTSLARGMAAGMEDLPAVDPNAPKWLQRLQKMTIKKRERLAATVYDTLDAEESTEVLDSMFREDTEDLIITTREEYNQAVFLVTSLELRFERGDRGNIDLFHFESVLTKEEKKLALYVAIARTKEALGTVSGEYYPDESPELLLETHRAIQEAANAALEAEIAKKDENFERHRIIERLKAGAIAGTIAGAAGFLAREALGMINASDSLPGGSGKPLIGVLEERQFSGVESTEHVLTAAEAATSRGFGGGAGVEISESLNLNLPSGAYYEQSQEIISVFDSSGELLQTINAPSGNLDTSEVSRLAELGFLKAKMTPTGESFSGVFEEPVELSEHISLRLPEDHDLIRVDGGYSINGSNGSSVAEFTVGSDGHITEEGAANLRANGFNISEAHALEPTTVEVEGMTPAEFSRSIETKNIDVVDWYGNRTPEADLNEIAPQITINEEGDVIVEITGMTPGGSFSEVASVDPLSAVEAGQVEFIVSMDPGNSGEVATFAFENVDGRVIATIPHDNGVAQFFGVEGGRGSYGFGGNSVMVGHVTGESGGVEEVISISSLRGPNVADNLTGYMDATQEASLITLTPEVSSVAPVYEVDLSSLVGGPEEYLEPHPIFIPFTRTSIGAIRYKTKEQGQDDVGPAPAPTPALPWRPPFGYLPAPKPDNEELNESDDLPPVITHPATQNELNFTEGTFNSSITAGPVENPEYSSEQISGDTFVSVYGGYGGSPVEIAQTRQEFSPSISVNPRVGLQTGSELTSYRNRVEQSGDKGKKYIESVDEVIENTPELATLPANTRAIVTLPVDISGSGGSVYKALNLFAAQKSDEALSATTILVYGYYPGVMTSDPNNTALSDFSAAIERFKINHPNVRIALVQKKVPDSIANDPVKVPGYIGRSMTDTALLSVEKAISEGAISPEQEILMIRNDIDQVGMSLNYLQRMIDEADKYPETDIFMGATLWNTSEQIESPGLGVVTNFKETMDLLSSRRPTDFERPTSGINTAVRMSTLAAVGGLGFGDYMGPGSDDLEIGRRVRLARAGGENILRHVTEAYIDTEGRSVVEAYRRNRSITVALPTEVGQRPVSSDSDLDEDKKDNLSSEEAFAPTLARIEHNLSEMASEWYQDPGLVESGLIHMFRKLDSGRDAYKVVWRNGVCTIRFTDVGKEELRNSLRRNSKGQFDSYARRKRREKYNYVAPGAKIQPRTAPRMAGPYSQPHQTARRRRGNAVYSTPRRTARERKLVYNTQG